MLEIINISFDGVLFTVGAVAAILAWKLLNKRTGHGLLFVALGLVLLSLVHMLESLMFLLMGFLDAAVMELVHRILVLAGFLWLFYGLARVAATLLQHAQRLQDSYDSIVQVLCAALDTRDEATEGHCRRVSLMAGFIARQLGASDAEVGVIEQAGMLHDIGKIGVADSVLYKPGPLDEREWKEMRRHPDLGYRMIEGIAFLKETAEIVRAHHERFDGQGYPRRLSGEDIPLGARIFAVADAYDAMTSDRPYRKALSHREAVDEIARNSGSQFDPAVVRAFLAAEERGLIPIPGIAEASERVRVPVETAVPSLVDTGC